MFSVLDREVSKWCITGVKYSSLTPILNKFGTYNVGWVG